MILEWKRPIGRLQIFLKDEKNYEIILEHKEKDLDPVNKRKMEIAYNAFEPFHLSKELNEINLEIRKKRPMNYL